MSAADQTGTTLPYPATLARLRAALAAVEAELAEAAETGDDHRPDEARDEDAPLLDRLRGRDRHCLGCTLGSEISGVQLALDEYERARGYR